MTEDSSQYRPPKHAHADGYGFDEAGERVPITLPASWTAAEPEERGSALAALDLVRRCLSLVCESGHRDGARTRAAALAFLLGLYATEAEGAKRLKIARSTMARAVEEMRRALLPQQPPIHRGTSPDNERQIE